MTDFIPSTTQEGQGGAQILSSNIQYANAGGVVRGIERGVDAMKEEQKYQREQERADALAKNKAINDLDASLSKIQIPDNIAVSERIIQEAWDKVNSGEDWETVFPKALTEIGQIQAFDRGIAANKGLYDNSRYFNEEEGTFIDGRERLATLYDGDASKYEGMSASEYIGYQSLNNDPQVSKNFYAKEPIDFNKELADFLNVTLDNYGVESTEPIFIGSKEGLKTTTSLEPAVIEQTRASLLKNKGMRDRYLKAIGLPSNHMEEEDMQRLWAKAVYEFRMPAKNSSGNFTKVETDNKGSGLVEGDDYIIDEGEDVKETRGTEEEVAAGNAKVTKEGGKFKRVTFSKDITIPQETKSGSVIEVKLQALKRKGDDIYGTILSPNVKATNSPQTYTEKEVKLTDKQKNKIKASGFDFGVLDKNNRQIEDDAIYYLIDGDVLTLDVIRSAYGGIPPEGAEKVTEKNKDMMEANRPDSAKAKEQGTPTNKRPPLSSFAKPKK